MNMTNLAIVGDVHGAIAPLRAAISWIDENWEGSVVFVGDYVNRGADSYLVMEELVALSSVWGDRLVLLMGNHDLGLLQFVADGTRSMFLGQGGLLTVQSYLRELSLPLDDHPLDVFAQHFPKSHKDLLEGMEITMETEDLLVTHAGFNPRNPSSRKIEDVVLGRHSSLFEASLQTPRPLVVCGHYMQRTGTPYVSEKFICLDSGCGSELGGPLSVLTLPDRQVRAFMEKNDD